MDGENNQGRIIVIDKKILAVAVATIIVIISAYFILNPPAKSEYIASDSPLLGSTAATIYLVEFSDYECPFCQAAEGTNQQIISQVKQSDPSWQAPIPNVIEEYVNSGKVRLVFRQFPVHQNKQPAYASKCAQEQGKFWEYHKLLFENYNALTDTDLRNYAVDLGLNVTQFNECLDSKKYEASTQKDLSDGQALGVSGTPTFFIGNDNIGYEKIVGALSFSEFKNIIDSQLTL